MDEVHLEIDFYRLFHQGVDAGLDVGQEVNGGVVVVFVIHAAKAGVGIQHGCCCQGEKENVFHIHCFYRANIAKKTVCASFVRPLIQLFLTEQKKCLIFLSENSMMPRWPFRG